MGSQVSENHHLHRQKNNQTRLDYKVQQLQFTTDRQMEKRYFLTLKCDQLKKETLVNAMTEYYQSKLSGSSQIHSNLFMDTDV